MYLSRCRESHNYTSEFLFFRDTYSNRLVRQSAILLQLDLLQFRYSCGVMARLSLVIVIGGAIVLVGLIRSSEALFGLSKPIHCKWHNSGLRPFCGSAPTCSSGKKLIPGTESKCGKNTFYCCATGNMMVCCPKEWEGNAANAMAVAIND